MLGLNRCARTRTMREIDGECLVFDSEFSWGEYIETLWVAVIGSGHRTIPSNALGDPYIAISNPKLPSG